ncbi:MAG: glycosyltransferase family 4 protein [Nitrospirae bacterium]|nr:glycosyltransferase family 4 protein [Nitrospirota bacterium]
MKIALFDVTITVSFGGVQTFIWGMANTLSRRGHEVHVYGGKGQILTSKADDICVYTYPFWDRNSIPDFGRRFRKFVERLSFAYYSLDDVVSNHYDVIYIHKPYDIPAALKVRRLTGASVVFSSHGTEFFPGYRSLVKKIDSFLSCSNFNASVIQDYCNVRPRVLYNGIDTDTFHPMKEDRGLKDALNIRNEKVIISACRLVGLKGIQYAIMALAEIVKRHYVKYLIIGDGEYLDELKQLAETLNVTDSVIFHKGVPNAELPAYYAISDIAVYPSVADETFGISIAEAMACAKPVVATSVGGIPEVIAPNTGILVTPREKESLTAALDTLLSDEALRTSMGVRARERVINNFSWHKIGQAFEDVVSSVVLKR